MKTDFLFLQNGGCRNIILLIFINLCLFQNDFGNNLMYKKNIPEIPKLY